MTEESQEEKIAIDLVERIVRGDSTAESELYNRYYERLKYFLTKIDGRESADDHCQEALTRVILRLREKGNLDDNSQLGRFIYRVGRNVALTAFRRRKRETPLTDEMAATYVNSDLKPDQNLLNDQVKALVLQAVRELPRSRDRKILKMWYVSESSTEEIAEALGIRRDNVRKVLLRARKRLAQLLKDSKDDLM